MLSWKLMMRIPLSPLTRAHYRVCCLMVLGLFADAVCGKLMVLFMPQSVCSSCDEMRNESRLCLWRDYGSKAKKQRENTKF